MSKQVLALGAAAATLFGAVASYVFWANKRQSDEDISRNPSPPYEEESENVEYLRKHKAQQRKLLALVEFAKAAAGDVDASRLGEIFWAYHELGHRKDVALFDRTFSNQLEAYYSSSDPTSIPKVIEHQNKLVDIINLRYIPKDIQLKYYRIRRHVVTRIIKPSTELSTSTTLIYDINEAFGDEMIPCEIWILEVPQSWRDRKLRHVVIVHRKDAKYWGGTGEPSESKWDTFGAYTMFFAKSANSMQLITWRENYGKGSSKKFAEYRLPDRPEHEDLHDFQALYDAGPFVEYVALTNVSAIEDLCIANIHTIKVEFFPENYESVEYMEKIFTPGTTFIDLAKGHTRPTYGGGYAWQHSSEDVYKRLVEVGLYPNALELLYEPNGERQVQVLDDGSYVDNEGALHIPLPPHKCFVCLEVSIGDTYFDKNQSIESQYNNNGHIGRCGWSKLYARLNNTEGMAIDTRYFMANCNIAPAGVLSGGPFTPHMTREGDEIVIECRLHAAWLMGYRISFRQA